MLPKAGVPLNLPGSPVAANLRALHVQLPRPLHRNPLHQRRQRDLLRLPPIYDRLDDLRRQQSQPQHAAHVGAVDLLRPGKLGDAAALPALQHPLPAKGARDRLHERVVDARPRAFGPAVRRDDELPAAAEMLGRTSASNDLVGRDCDEADQYRLSAASLR